MPFCGMEVRPMEDIIKLIGSILALTVWFTFHIVGIIALIKYIAA